MMLKWENQDDWSFQPFEFSTPPWQTEDLQEEELTLTPHSDTYEATWQHEEEGDTTQEHTPAPGDILRASYYTERREAWQPARETYSELSICENVLSATYTAGQNSHGKAKKPTNTTSAPPALQPPTSYRAASPPPTTRTTSSSPKN